MSQAAIAARGLTRRFGPVTALHPLDLEVPAGAALAVLGPNGAGKSTLLRLVAGLLRPSAGSLQVGRSGDDRVARRREIGLIGHATFLYPALTARENLRLAGRLHGLGDVEERAQQLLDEVGLGAVSERQAGGFSRGMAQRLAIARALMHDPALLLLDEPFTGLDPRGAERLTARLAALRDAGRTLLLVTHDLPRAAQLADRGLVLARGRARALPAASLDAAEALTQAYTAAVEEIGGQLQ